MTTPPSSPAADRNLIFGLLALQMDFVSREHLLEAMNVREGRLDRVGVASDVFALGATLYALLTGRAPYGGTDVVAQARRGEVVPARQRKRSVPAALEAICAKAMAKRPEDRYPMAKALAEEVQRWLADEPVLAYPEPLADRLRRWVRRNRSVVTGGVVLLPVGVVALGVGLWLVNQEKERTEQQRDRAVEAEEGERRRRSEAETNLARALNAEGQAKANLKLAQDNLKLARQAIDECFNIARSDPPFQGPRMEKARNLLLRKTLPFYRNFRVQRPDDRALQREGADQWFRVGYIEYVLLRTSQAREAYERAREQFRTLVKAHPDLPEYADALARTCLNRGYLLQQMNRDGEALVDLVQGIAQTDRLHKLDSNHPMIGPFLLFGLPRRALLLARLSRGDEADADWNRVLRIAPASKRLGLRLQRADSRARAGDYRRSATEANEQP